MPGGASKRRAPQGRRRRSRPRRTRTVTLTLCPGAEMWVRVECGDRVFFRPGAVTALELMVDLLNGT